MILVFVLFDGNGYVGWKCGMLIVLFVKNKVSFVNGKCKKFNDDLFILINWERCNDMVIFWILNVLVKDIVDSVLYSIIVRDIWFEFE